MQPWLGLNCSSAVDDDAGDATAAIDEEAGADDEAEPSADVTALCAVEDRAAVEV